MPLFAAHDTVWVDFISSYFLAFEFVYFSGVLWQGEMDLYEEKKLIYLIYGLSTLMIWSALS